MEEAQHSNNASVDSAFLTPPQAENITISPRAESIQFPPSRASFIVPVTQEEKDETWKTCCSKSERSFIKFVVQVSMGLLVITFCMGLIALGDGEHDMICFSLISGTMGLFFPHPSMTPTSPNE